jgi:hypothetical protein
MKLTRIFPHLAVAALAASSAHGAVINISDYTLVPDGTNFGFSNALGNTEEQRTNFKATNGNLATVNAAQPVAYFVTTFTFGTGTSATINLNFGASAGQERLGISITSAGLAAGSGDGDSYNAFFDYDFGSSMSGQTVTIMGKFQFDANNSVTYGETNASNDTVATFWINPTVGTLEGSGLPDGYVKPNNLPVVGTTIPNANYTGDVSSRPWNSSGYETFRQRIANNSTPGTAGSSSITNTTILTGTDATFSNALALATVPEPSTALLGGLGLLALLRRRRIA